jgi:hypothetical protein
MSKVFSEEIKIGSTFDAKGFKQAESALTQMNKTFKTAAKTLGISYGTAQLLAYAKGAVKAAAEDQRATNILANNLKNVGLAYAAIDSEKFIQNMQTQTGILDDSLRPAFAKLASTTGSIAKTQELMSLAFDASNGSGVDFASTIDILSKAYVGNTKGAIQWCWQSGNRFICRAVADSFNSSDQCSGDYWLWPVRSSEGYNWSNRRTDFGRTDWLACY